MAERTDKVRENRLRRMALRQNRTLARRRRRDPLAADYGTYDLDGQTYPSLDAVEQALTQKRDP